ncbi:MAG: DUF3794 and LysM peptidoglycan-binding domain-containing protein [Acetivibrionales bacterium]
MSLELVREAIRLNQVIGSETSQTVVDSDIIVPDIKPDIAHILLLDGDVFVNSSEVIQNKVLINATINYRILYVPEDEVNSVKGINTSTDFSYSLDIADSEQGMKCRVKCDLEHLEYEILNGRKINVKAIVKVDGKVVNEVEYQVASDLVGLDNIQVLRGKYCINSYLGSSQEHCDINEILEIPLEKPTIKEILRTDVRISEKDVKLTENKVIAKGELNISTLYTGDDEQETIQFMEHGIPFTHIIDFPGINENSNCRVDYSISNLQFDPEEDGDGELRSIKAQATIVMSAEGYEDRDVEIISDAYSPDRRLDLEQKAIDMEEIVEERMHQIAVKDVFEVQEENPEIQELLNVLCKSALSDYRVYDGKVIIEGVVNNNVLYLPENSEQPVSCGIKEIPFEEEIHIPVLGKEMHCDVDLSVEHCNYSLQSARRVEIRAMIKAAVKVSRRIEVPLLDSVEEIELDERSLDERPSVIIYFTQPGDTLWSIAKRYFTTVDDLRRANNLGEGDTAVAGQQVIIPRRKIN